MARIVPGTLGEEIHVTDGEYLGMTAAVSGGDPAHIFLFVEALVDAGLRIGLSRDMAQELVIQTILGSPLTVERTGKHPANLRNMVTSPGGTTAGALLQLEKGRFRSLVLEAVAAAYEEAKRF